MTADRADFAVLGASGMTGRAVLSHLRDRLKGPTKWIIAGRDTSRLEAAAKTFPDHIRPRVMVIGDLEDAPLDDLCNNVRWLAILAGPYACHGHRVIDACLESGTHYLDLCGEVDVIRQWVDLFLDRANSLGVQVIPAAGFESLPFDLLTASAVARLGTGETGQAVNIDILMSYSGLSWAEFPNYASTGTIATAFETLLRNPSAEQLLDPLSLSSTYRDAARASTSRIHLSAWYDDEYRVWRAPLVPGPFTNPAIVHRSNGLLSETGAGYGSNFAYNENMNVSSIAPWPVGQGMIATAIATSSRQFLSALGSDSLQRRSTLALWKNLSEKPPALIDRDLDRVDYQLDVTATRRGSPPVRARLTGKGHPGYRSTGNIVGELLLGLGEAGDNVQSGGVLTPSVALGSGWLNRLGPAGLHCHWF